MSVSSSTPTSISSSISLYGWEFRPSPDGKDDPYIKKFFTSLWKLFSGSDKNVDLNKMTFWQECNYVDATEALADIFLRNIPVYKKPQEHTALFAAAEYVNVSRTFFVSPASLMR